MPKRWSKLQKRLYALMDPAAEFQIHCALYEMNSNDGWHGNKLPRYWITIGKEIVFDYPKNFDTTERYGFNSYPWDTDIGGISQAIEDYIQCPETELMNTFESDRWGITDILRLCDRRIGKRRLRELQSMVDDEVLSGIIDRRLQHKEKSQAPGRATMSRKNDNKTENGAILTQKEINMLLNGVDKSSSGKESGSPIKYKETAVTILPHIEIGDVCRIELVDSYNGQQCTDECLYRIKMNSGHDYFVLIENMDDPSLGLFGAFGSWTPYHTILLDENMNKVSEHCENHGADIVRIRDILPQSSCFGIEMDHPHEFNKEQVIRWLTIMNMITSNYLSEIQDINSEIIRQYQIGCEANKKLRELNERRFAYFGTMMNWSIGKFEDIEEVKKKRLRSM